MLRAGGLGKSGYMFAGVSWKICTLKARFRKTSWYVGFVSFFLLKNEWWVQLWGVQWPECQGTPPGRDRLKFHLEIIKHFLSCPLQFAWHSALPQLSPSLLVLLANSPLPLCSFPQLSMLKSSSHHASHWCLHDAARSPCAKAREQSSCLQCFSRLFHSGLHF